MHLLEAMPAADFALYQAYAAERLLPAQRIELHLARIGMQLDILAGHQGRPLESYLIPRPPATTTEPQANELTDAQADNLATQIGFSPRPRRRPREDPTPEPETPSP